MCPVARAHGDSGGIAAGEWIGREDIGRERLTGHFIGEIGARIETGEGGLGIGEISLDAVEIERTGIGGVRVGVLAVRHRLQL